MGIWRGTIYKMAIARAKVRKAVIAAAGFGTRFLPQTKAMPKEMLPIVDKPIIQYIVEELVAAGINDIIIVTGYHKRAIEDHFDQMSGDLRASLTLNHKLELLEETQKVSDMANFAYIRQKGPLGNVTPLLNVEQYVGDEPFIYMYPDDLILATPNRFTQMIDLYNELGGVIVPCMRAKSDKDYERYGIVDGKKIRDGVVAMNKIIEKPGRAKAPSDLASIGGYLLTPDIFGYVRQALTKHNPRQEFQIQPAMQAMMDDGLPFYGAEMKNSTYYDTGNKLDYLKTVVEFALQHPELKDEFRDYLREVL